MESELNLIQSEDNYIEINNIKKIKNNNNILLNITSEYNLKQIFSYIKYDYILKLIKKNKSLQNKLGISKENYKEYLDVEYISIMNKKKREVRLY